MDIIPKIEHLLRPEKQILKGWCLDRIPLHFESPQIGARKQSSGESFEAIPSQHMGQFSEIRFEMNSSLFHHTSSI